MPKENRILNRCSIRLKGYDYGQTGGYFVTICTKDQGCLLGEIIDSQVILNEFGKIVKEEWERSSSIRREIILDEFIVMPNHLHGIIFIENHRNQGVGATGRSPLQKMARGPQKSSLGSFVSNYKAAVTIRCREISHSDNLLVWHRNYYEHIIRNETDLEEIREYIQNNPLKWLEDKNNPVNIKI